MTQARMRSVQGDLPAAAVGVAAPPTKPNQVTLPGGRVIAFRRLSGLDSSLMEQAMEDAGFTKISGPGRATHLRCTAAYAIHEVDGQMQAPPESGPALRLRLAGYEEEDWGLILQAYLRFIGQLPAASADGAVPPEATFP